MNNIDSLYHIISFNLWIACPGWDPHECKSNSNQITECMKNGFMKLRYNGGCRVYFDKIMCVGKNNDTLELSALSFKTKELILKNK
jgi:hypothetical protein